MDFSEFQKMLLESLRNESVKSELLRLLSEENVSAEIEGYVNKIKELEEQLSKASKESEEKYSSLLAEFNDLSGTSAAVKLESENKDKTIAELNERLSAFTASGNDSEKISADRIARLTEELDKLKTDYAEKEKKLTELSKSEAALKSKLSESGNAAEEMKKQLESSGSEKDKEISRLTEKTESLSAELEKLKKDNDEMSAKLSDADSKLISVQEAESAKNKELSKNIADMDVKIAGYISELDDAKKELEQKNKLIEEFKNSTESRSSELTDRIAALTEELSNAKSNADKLAADADTYKASAEQSAAKLRETEVQLSEARQASEQKDSTIATMNTQLQGMLVLRQKINEYAETANAYAEEVENARNILAEREGTVNALNARVSELSEQNGSLSAKVDQYAEAINTKNAQIDEIGKYAESLKNHSEELSSQILQRNSEISAKIGEIDSLKKDIEAYNLTFGDLTKMFEKFQNLAPKTKEGLTDVFTENLNIRSFLSSGAQWGHIQALWEYTQRKINDEDFTDVGILNEIFRYFLDFHNSSYASPLYALLDTKPGDAFDEDQHYKIMSREERKAAFFDNKKKNTVDGPIKEVVLYGYKNLKNGRVLKPSVVRV